MLAKEGTKLFLLLHVSCVAETVHSSNVRLGSAGVATLVLEQVPLFSGDVILIGISCCCPPEPEILTLDTCILDTVCITTSSTSLHSYGGEQLYMAAGRYPTGRAVQYHTRYSGHTHSRSRDGQILDD